MPCLLPTKSPWLNAIEPQWICLQRKVKLEPERLLGAYESPREFAKSSAVITKSIYPFPGGRLNALGMASAAACVAAFMWWKAPAASAQVVASPCGGLCRGGLCGPAATLATATPTTRSFSLAAQGAAHSHDFFANRSTKYDSTYGSLRTATGTTSGTTCVNPDDKSAYWIPTTSWTDNSGTRTLKASTAHFYYRAGGNPEDVYCPAGGIEGGSKHARQLEVLRSHGC